MTTTTENLARATQLHRDGKFQEAEKVYRQVVESDPKHFHAWHFLGAACQAQGNLSEAVSSLRRAAELNPQAAEVRDHLGVLLAQQGHFAEALGHLQEAVRLQPQVAEFLNHLGITIAQMGKLANAVGCFQQALKLTPGSAGIQYNLGNAYLLLGAVPDAIHCFQDALRLTPNYVDAHRGLAAALTEVGRFDEAVIQLGEVVRLKPGDAEAHRDLANTLQMQGKFDEAAASCREALRLRPDYAEPHNCLGAILLEQGQLDDAVTYFQMAKELKPELPMPYLNLADLARQGRYEFSDAEVNQVQLLLADANRSLSDRSALHFALAYVFDKRKVFETAFEHFFRGNELKKQHWRQRGRAFDQQNHRKWVDRLIGAFTPQYFRKVDAWGADSEKPVFVVGVPRSGTTLVTQILSSHPRMTAAGELTDVQQMVDELPQLLRQSETYPGCLSAIDAKAVEALAKRYLERISSIDPKKQRPLNPAPLPRGSEENEGSELHSQEGGERSHAGQPRHGEEGRSGSVERERKMACEVSPEALRVVDKMPENYFHLGLIATLFPKARVIHCQRDPIDVCLSCYMQNFREAIFACDLEDLGVYYQEYERLMRHWRAVLPMRVLDVRYEELVGDQETVSRELISFCGLDWDDRCLAFHENSQWVRTASRVQVRQPMYRSSVGRSKSYESYLRPLREALGKQG
jgi:tetratricopeptide (TPR) repeat protein